MNINDQLKAMMEEPQKYTSEQIKAMKNMLILRDVEQVDDEVLYSVFSEGCTGWDNFSQEHIIEHFFIHFDESDLK